MRIFKIFPALLFAVMLCLSGNVSAKSYPQGGLTSTDQYEINSSTPGHQKVLGGYGLGSGLAGFFVGGVFGTKNDGVGNITATSPDTTLAFLSISPTTTLSSYGVVLWTVPLTAFSWALHNGIPGQVETIVKVNTGASPGKITPDTVTGFTDITLTNQGDGVELRYQDDSTGWVCAGVFGGSTTGKCNP